MRDDPGKPLPSVLLVDDDEAFLQVLSQSLQKRGYEVFTATCIAQVKTCLSEVKPQYAVIDLHIGDEHGLDALDLIRAQTPSAIPVILSGYIDVGTAAVATKRGAADCLVKPVSLEELEHALLNGRAPGRTPLPDVISPHDAQLQHIISRWEKNERNTSKTATELGMHRRTLQRVLERAGIVRSEMESGRSVSRIEMLASRYRNWMGRLSSRPSGLSEKQ